MHRYLHGRANCSVCKFNFGDFYGHVGGGYIHVHHLRQLSEVSADYVVDPVSDLRSICPTPAAIIPQRTPAVAVSRKPRSSSVQNRAPDRAQQQTLR